MEWQYCVTNQEMPYVWFEMMNPEALKAHRLIINTETVALIAIIAHFSPNTAAC